MDLATAFALAVARRPEACAIIDDGEAHTYAQWHAESLRVAGGLGRLGLAQGDRLLVLLKNRYETTVLYWACQALGVVFTPLNWRARAQKWPFCLEDSDAKVVAFEGSRRTRPRGAGTVRSRRRATHRRWGGTSEARHIPYTGLAESEPPSKPAMVGEHSTCLMLYTSGTTGRPKGVPRTHRNELSAAVSQIAHNRYLFGRVPRSGSCTIYHTMGVRVLLSTALLNGKFVCVPTYDTEQVLGLIGPDASRRCSSCQHYISTSCVIRACAPSIFRRSLG